MYQILLSVQGLILLINAHVERPLGTALAAYTVLFIDYWLPMMVSI